MERLAELFAPWQAAYGDSTAIAVSVTTAHLVALFLGGGLAVAADRATLRLTGAASGASYTDRMRQLSELHDVHRPVLIALGALFVSGALLAAADVETFATSPLFWVKMGLVALLLVNGWMLRQTERALAAQPPSDVPEPKAVTLWRRLRRSAGASLSLWVVIVIVGAVLVNA